jgi:hypothetical protein
VLPARDVAPFVGPAVAALSAQDWSDIELLAVDDGSRDGTGAALEAAAADFRRSGPGRRAEVIALPGRGLGAARNAALDRATGAWILFADGDDLLDPGAVAALVAALRADPGACIAFPRCRYVDARGAPMGLESALRPEPLGPADLLAENPVHTDTGLLIRRHALDRAGRFDEALPSAVGLEFWVRAAGAWAAGGGRPDCLVQIPPVLVSYRRRDGQITADWRRQRAGWEAVAARAAASGLLGRTALRRARARAMLVWAAGAWAAGEGAALRGLVAGALRRDPAAVLGSGHGRLKLAAALASPLPPRWQAALAALRTRWATPRADAGNRAESRR